MSLKTILQTPAVLLILALVAIGVLVLIGGDVLLGVVVVVPFIVCVWLVRNHHLTLLRQAMGEVRKSKTFTTQNQES